MMKAQLTGSATHPTLQVCGKLAGPWVEELERFWMASVSSHPQVSISVDLRCITFIDDSGRQLLLRMHQQGARFQVSGVLTREIVETITRK